MHVHRIEVHHPPDQAQEPIIELFDRLLGALRMNGQICGTESPIYNEENRCVAIVLAPEKMSMDPRFNSQYVTAAARETESLGAAISFVHVAKDCSSSLEICSCHDSSGYILFTDYVSLEPPVRCLDCFQPVPLYRFPTMPSGEYYEIICWQSDYQSCDRLQMNCATLERSATQQMSDLRSKLSEAGRRNCRILEDSSGKPVYYYLYRSSARSVRAEKQRRCPSCGEPWFLDMELHSLFHCRCDACRLLSNFAWNLSDSLRWEA